MKTVLIEGVPQEDGEAQIRIEVESPREDQWREYSPKQVRSGSRLFSGNHFEEAMKLVQLCAERVSASVQHVAEKSRPSAVEVQFGVKITGEAGALIAKTGSEAQLEVKLVWEKI